MSGLGALNSLSATYTDSEEEEVEEDQETDNESLALSNAPLFPADSVKESLSSSGPPSVTKDAPLPSSAPPPNASSGLVSYHLDDQIDDDAVDDYQSDSVSDKDEETKMKGSVEGEEDPKSPHVLPPPEETPQEGEGEGGGGGKVRIPPEPPGPPSQELQERVSRLYSIKVKQGLDMNVHIQRNKQFRNPSIYEKLIKHCNIDELGTNYPPEIYNPHEWKESSFYDELAKIQKADMERREKEKKERTKVEFISGTAVKKPTPSAPIPVQPVGGAFSALDAEKRKSKWDQRGAMPGVPHNFQASQPTLMQPNLATAITGTKSTVINAFGNLPKKPKQ